MREMQPSCTPRDARIDPMRTTWLRVLPQGSARNEQVARRLMQNRRSPGNSQPERTEMIPYGYWSQS